MLQKDWRSHVCSEYAGKAMEEAYKKSQMQSLCVENQRLHMQQELGKSGCRGSDRPLRGHKPFWC